MCVSLLRLGVGQYGMVGTTFSVTHAKLRAVPDIRKHPYINYS